MQRYRVSWSFPTTQFISVCSLNCFLEHWSLTDLWVQAHFEEALTARHRGSDSKKLVTKGVRGKIAAEKLSEETLVKLSSRVKMQVTLNTVYVTLLIN